MKKDIHPTYHEKTTITCSCGAVLEVGSTEEAPQTEICSQCHPFYTGKKKIVDTTGRVDRFKKIAKRSQEKKESHSKIKKAKKARVEEKIQAETKTNK